jgi:hypothetical protein
MRDQEMDDQLVLYGRIFTSRLLLGTARYESPRQLTEAISAAALPCSRCPCGASSRPRKILASPFGTCFGRRGGRFSPIPLAASVHVRQ